MTTTERVPVVDGLFDWGDHDAFLIASRCNCCGQHYFPKSLTCRNPDCSRRDDVREVRLSSTGLLYSYTMQYFRPPGLFRMDSWEPYAIGQIDLPEGLRVMGMLTGFDVNNILIGTKVKVTTGALYRDENGREIITYMFSPVLNNGK